MSTTAPSLLVDAPIVFVTGKGGVGKTTVAAALAWDSSRQGHRSALVEFDDGEAGRRTLGRAIAQVEHVVLTYEDSLVDTLGSVLGARIIARALISHGALSRLVDAIPALREFAFLDSVRRLLETGRFDRIVVDLPASGHALDWLRVPRAFSRFLGVSPLGRIGTKIQEQVVKPGRSDVVVVSLAEPLVVKETEQLCKRLEEELDTVPALIVVNRVVQLDPEGAWEATDELIKGQSRLADDAHVVQQILEARADRSDETAYAVGLARALKARRVLSLPDAPDDPNAEQVASWLIQGEV